MSRTYAVEIVVVTMDDGIITHTSDGSRLGPSYENEDDAQDQLDEIEAQARAVPGLINTNNERTK